MLRAANCREHFYTYTIMRLTLTFLLAFMLIGSPVLANDLFIEAGPGILKSFHSFGAFLRYQRETSRLFNFPSYYEAVGAYWTNSCHAAGLGFARGIEWRKEEKQRFFSTDFGIMGISRTTEHLGTRFQFYFRMAYNTEISGREASLGFIHVSNGKLVFHWDGPNSGENFITLAVNLF